MPQESANDISRYTPEQLLVAIAGGMDSQKDSLLLLRQDMVKGFSETNALLNARMDKIEGTQERLEIRIDKIEQRQDILDTLVGSSKWLLGLLLVPYVGLVVSLLVQ